MEQEPIEDSKPPEDPIINVLNGVKDKEDWIDYNVKINAGLVLGSLITEDRNVDSERAAAFFVGTLNLDENDRVGVRKAEGLAVLGGIWGKLEPRTRSELAEAIRAKKDLIIEKRFNAFLGTLNRLEK